MSLSPKIAKPAAFLIAIEEAVEGHYNLGIFGAEFSHFRDSAHDAAPSLAGPGVDDPDVADAEVEEIGDAFLHVRQAVVFGQDFDADKRRRFEDLFHRFAEYHTDIRHAKAGGRDLHALLGHDANSPLIPPGMKIEKRLAL